MIRKLFLIVAMALAVACGDDKEKASTDLTVPEGTGLLVPGLYNTAFTVTRDDKTPENVGNKGNMEWALQDEGDGNWNLMVKGNTAAFPGIEQDSKLEFYFEEEVGQKFDGCENFNKIWATVIPSKSRKDFTGPIAQTYHWCPVSIADEQSSTCLVCSGEMTFNADTSGTLRE